MCDCLTGVAKHQDFKLYEDEPINPTDIPQSLQQLQDNDPKLTHLNINNIKVTPAQQCRKDSENIRGSLGIYTVISIVTFQMI